MQENRNESLYWQTERAREKKRKLKWKLDVKVVSVERESETNRVSNEDKVRAVLAELEVQRLIGSIEERKPYIKGIFPLQWGIYKRHRPEADHRRSARLLRRDPGRRPAGSRRFIPPH